MLEAKWPEKYNGFGHLSWAGRIYGNGLTLPIKLKKDKIFHGIWGSAPFQSIYQQAPNFISCIPLMPEWNLLLILLGFLSVLSISWTPLLWVLPFFFLAQVIVFIQAGLSAAKSLATKKLKSRVHYLKYWGLTTLLHVIQPIARLYGRIAHGLSPWRKRGSNSFKWSFIVKNAISLTHWSETWKANEEWLSEIEYALIKSRTRVRRGGHYDPWDLNVTCGFFSGVTGLLTVEEHGGGKQLLRFKCRPKFSSTCIALTIILAILCVLAILDTSYVASVFLGFFALVLGITNFTDKARAMYDITKAFTSLSESEPNPVPVVETLKELQLVIAEKVIHLPDLFQEAREVKNHVRHDSRQKRILEAAVENFEELKII